MSRTHVDESRLLATAIALLAAGTLARGSAKAVGLVVLLGIVVASVGVLTVGVALLRLATV